MSKEWELEVVEHRIYKVLYETTAETEEEARQNYLDGKAYELEDEFEDVADYKILEATLIREKP